jgi:hypothetical protein
MENRLLPGLVMKVVAVAAILGLALLATASPGIWDVWVRGGEPMEPLSRHRLNVLRATLAPLAVATAAFALWQRDARDWRPFQQLIFAVPFAAIIVVVVYKIVFGVADRRYLMFVREDGLVEYGTAIALLIGSAVAARAVTLASDHQTRAFLAAFSLGMLFIAVSEVSFGQRLLGLETPGALRAINRQEEISLHNIPGIEFVVYRIMPHLILIYALLSRWGARRLSGSPLSGELLAVAPVPWYAVGYFVPMSLFSAKQHLLRLDPVFKDQEPAELSMAVGFVLVALQALAILAHPERRAPAKASLGGSRPVGR